MRQEHSTSIAIPILMLACGILHKTPADLPSELNDPGPDMSYRSAVERWMTQGKATVATNPHRPRGWRSYEFQIGNESSDSLAWAALSGFRDLCTGYDGRPVWAGEFDGRPRWEWDWDRIQNGTGQLDFTRCERNGWPARCPANYYVACLKNGPFAAMSLERHGSVMLLEHYSSDELMKAKETTELQQHKEQEQRRVEEERREEEDAAATLAFRQGLKPGDQASIPEKNLQLGTLRKRALVVEVKPPLARVQTYNPPQELWVPIDSLEPASPNDAP